MSNTEQDLPSLSAEARAALDIFYDEFNDIHFFVEDADQENLYGVVLRKLFPTLRIARVIPLGGKSAVIAHAQSTPQATDSPFRAYLLDKDLDDYLGKCVDHPSIFYLDRYCIENYLVSAEAVIEIVIESHPKLSRDSISGTLNCGQQIETIVGSLRRLFALFYCVQKFNLALKNCSAPPETFCHTLRRWEIEPTAVEEYARQVGAAAVAAGLGDELSDPFVLPDVLALVRAEAHCAVSGKYICALLFHYIKSKYSLGSITFHSFVYRLAKNCSIAALSGLSERIATTAAVANQRYHSLVLPAA